MTPDKPKPRDLGFALVDNFSDRQSTADAIENLTRQTSEVEKNNPYRDRATGRFTFGPANDMGGGSAAGGLSADERARREQFKQVVAEKREAMPDPDGMYVGSEAEQAEQLRDSIELGGVVRDEIYRREQAAVSSPEYAAEKRRREAEALKKEEIATVRSRENMENQRDNRIAKDEAKTARRELNEAVEASPEYQALMDRRAELTQQMQTLQSRETIRTRQVEIEHRARTGSQYADNVQYQRGLRDAFANDPELRAIAKEKAIVEDNLRNNRRMDSEIKYAGWDKSEVFWMEGTGTGPVTISPQNPLATPAVMAARGRLDRAEAVAAMQSKSAKASQKRADEAFKELAIAKAAVHGQRNQARREAIKSTLQDAGVEFSPGKVVFRKDGAGAVSKAIEDGNIVTLGSRRSKAVTSVEQSAPYLPKRWASSTSQTAVERRGGMEIKFDKNKRGEFGDFEIITDGRNTSLHELIHGVEASRPSLLRAEATFYKYRTSGESPVRLSSVSRGRYRADEITRPDKFYDAYLGKDYRGRYYELVTTAYSDMIFPRGSKNPFDDLDPELQAWIWSTVILT